VRAQADFGRTQEMSQVICSSQRNLRLNGSPHPVVRPAPGSTHVLGNVFNITKAVSGEQRDAVQIRERDGGGWPASGASQCHRSV
jgi:hypothetical protein